MSDEGNPATAWRHGSVEVVHGHRVEDPYRWLEDSDASATREWEERQSKRFEAARAGWTTREMFVDALHKLAAYERVSPPLVRGERMFYTRRSVGADFAVLLVRESDGDRILVDTAALDPTGRTTLDAWSPSPDGRLLAYQVSSSGTEHSALRVMDVATCRDVDGPINRVRRTPVGWLPDGSGFYYVRRLAVESQYDRRIHLHRVSADADGDPCVFGEGRGATQFYHVAVSPCGRWLTVRASEGATPSNDLWIADLAGTAPERPVFRVVHEGVAAKTVPSFIGDRLLIRTDLDAPMGYVVTAPAANPTPGNWTTFISARDDAVLQDFVVLADAGTALASWLVDGAHSVTTHNLTTGASTGRVDLPGIGTVNRIEVAWPHSDVAYLEYTDYATPPTVLHFDAVAKTTRRWEPDVPSGMVPGVVTRSVMVTSRDGTRVPMFVMSSDGRPDRPRPGLLTAYGGFGVPLTPAYSPEALAWVCAGGVYAVAGVRGGGERGRSWHLDAVRGRRQNAFDDFDAAARHLVSAGWTAHDTLGIHGSSNGGLLMCVALTQNPQRYAAVVAAAPLTDMIRYEATGMGPSWRDEYGTAADMDDFATLAGYSPYHHVAPGVDYPAVMLAAFGGDSRVDPMHSRKMCAALLSASRGGPVLYRMEHSVGHGSRPVSSTVELFADMLAFLATETRLDVIHGDRQSVISCGDVG